MFICIDCPGRCTCTFTCTTCGATREGKPNHPTGDCDDRATTVDSANMVTEPCEARANCVDVLCVLCGWTGHCEPHQAPWPLFMGHHCR